MELDIKNAHPRDAHIKFDEPTHIYTIKGMDDTPISVTTLIESFFGSFNSDAVIDRMMASDNWPQSKYYGQTKEQIDQNWKDSGDESSRLGNELHEAIDYFMNGELEPDQVPITPEFLYFLQFYQDLIMLNPGWKLYRTEWRIFDRELKIAGSIDMVLINSSGDLWLLDWKRSKKVSLQGSTKAKRPISHLDDCKYNKYSI